MRKLVISAIVLMALGLAVTTANAAIVGSKHDFSGQNWSKQQICLPCHTPHNAMKTDPFGNPIEGPLWNHQISTAAYTLFDGTKTISKDSNGNDVAGTGGEIDGNSMLCLSCHDGTVALDSFGGATGSTLIPNSALIGTDLSNDHPIGSAGEYPTTDGLTSTKTYMVDPQIFVGGVNLKQLNGKYVVGCTSCHEPHDRARLGPDGHLLRMSNTSTVTLGYQYGNTGSAVVPSSGLCLNCHKSK